MAASKSLFTADEALHSPADCKFLLIGDEHPAQHHFREHPPRKDQDRSRRTRRSKSHRYSVNMLTDGNSCHDAGLVLHN